MDKFTINSISRIKPIYDYLKKQQENEKFLKTIEIGATFVLITFFVVFAIRPTAYAISKLLGDIESKKLLKTQLSQKINDVIIAQDIFSQVEGKYDIVNSSLPDKPSFYDSFNQIKYSSNPDIILNKISFNQNDDSKQNSNSNLQTYSTSISSTGSFISSIELAEKLLKNQRLISINSISFSNQSIISPASSPSATNSTGGLGTNINIVFNYWPANK